MAPTDDDPSSSPPQLRGPPPGATAPPDHVVNGKPQIYEIFNAGRSEERRFPSGPAAMTTAAGATASSSAAPPGSSPSSQGVTKQQQHAPSFTEGVQSIKSDDFFRIHKIPCARSGFMTGIAAGAVVGMGRFVFGARIGRATNWAFGSFMLGSIVQWEVCQYQVRQEKVGMARVIEVMDRKQAEKKAQAQEAVARRRREAEEKAKEEEARKRWYKFW
ncbi:cytochrome c oxidase assembly protein subunit 20 [Microdochium nivale]|nr:cytochrome c oxidase assembly protein subunit 20 [Microdochium nivale]